MSEYHPLKATLTDEELRAYLGGISTDTLASYRDQGLPYTKIGKFRYYSRDLVDGWIKRRILDGAHHSGQGIKKGAPLTPVDI